MNRNRKGLMIGAGGGLGTQLGQVLHYGLERGLGDFPPEIDAAVIGIVAAAAAYAAYRWLPAIPPAVASSDSGV